MIALAECEDCGFVVKVATKGASPRFCPQHGGPLPVSAYTKVRTANPGREMPTHAGSGAKVNM